MFDLDVKMSESGPIFNGTAEPIIKHGCTEAEKAVAHDAEDMVRQRLGHVLKHPTGRYMSRIHSVARGLGHEVNDGHIVYGPWLEGVGSRNFPVTRFPGYATFRIVGQQVEGKAEKISDPHIDRAARRL